MNDECRQPLFLDADQETSPTVFRKSRPNGHCMRLLPWAIILVLVNALVFQNVYYQWHKTDCGFEPVYPTDFGTFAILSASCLLHQLNHIRTDEALH